MITTLTATELSPTEAVTRYLEITLSHWSDLLKLLSDTSLQHILHQKQEQDLLTDSLDFNLFRLISGIYYRENFHSDIMRALLEPSESHEAGHRHVHAFIDWLKKWRDLEGLNLKHFQDVEVKREKHGRVDIVICNKFSKKAIIVENKINGAPDMPRQLPRYLDNLEKDGFEVVAIVYLTLNQIKMPVETEWLPAIGNNPSDHDRIYKLLIPVVAFSHVSPSLLDWIQEGERNTTQFDTLAALRQYRQLIQHLGAHAMNDTLMEKFYEKITDPTDPSFLPNAKSLVNIMNDLPEYRTCRLKKIFESDCRPFTKIHCGGCSGGCSGGCRIIFSDDGGGDYDFLNVDVWCFESSSILAIWDSGFEDHKLSRINIVVSEAAMDGFLEECSQDDSKRGISDSLIKTYRFPEEEKNLESDLKDIFLKLKKWKLDRQVKSAAHS